MVFQLRALFLRLLSLQLPRSPRCPPLLPSPLSGPLWGSPLYLLCPPLLFLLLQLWGVLRYSCLRCSVSLRTFRHWFVGLWPTGVQLFASVLSFLVFVLILLMVFLAFYLLCLSLLRSLLLTLCLLLSLRSVPYLAPVAPVPFSSFLAPSAAPHRFIAHSLTFLSSTGSSSSLLPVPRAPPVYSTCSLSISSCRAFPWGFWCCSGVRCGHCFSYCLFSFPSFRWGSNSFRGGSCGYSPFDFPFHPFCSGVLSG